MEAMVEVGGGTLPRLLIFPFNGNAIEALACATASFETIGFIDDMPDKIGRNFGGIPVLTRAALEDWPNAQVLAVPGSPRTFRERRAVIEGLALTPGRFTRVIHPRATVSPFAILGENMLLMAGVVVTSTAMIGDHVCILPNAVIHHDVIIGAWSLIGSNVTLAGGVKVGDNCYIGSGASVRDGVTIGDGALVGLGSTVIRDVEPHTIVAGSPARPLPQSGLHGLPQQYTAR